MKPGDARHMSVDQLDDELVKLKKEQFNLRFQRATGQLENTSRVRVIRRDIARMKTIAAQKRVGAEPAAKTASKTTTAKPAVKTNKTPKSARRKAATQSPPRAAKRAIAHKPNKSKK